MLLPNINVWLALTFESHIHHPAAKTWFEGLTDEGCSFCRMTQQGFLRLAGGGLVLGLVPAIFRLPARPRCTGGEETA